MAAPDPGLSAADVFRVSVTHCPRVHFLVVLWVEAKPFMLPCGNVLFAILFKEELKEVQMTTIINFWPRGSVSLKRAPFPMVKEGVREASEQHPSQPPRWTAETKCLGRREKL